MTDLNHPFWQAVRGEVPMPACAGTLGTEVLEAEPDSGRIRLRFQARPEFCNPTGTIQGGFLAAMLDDVMGTALATTFDRGEFSPTLELRVSFLEPARPGPLLAEGRVTRRGRNIAFLEGSLWREDGSLIATGTATSRLIHLSDARMTPEPPGA